MLWKLGKRRINTRKYRNLWYTCCLVLTLIVFTNILVIQKKFDFLEGENFIDTGGTNADSNLGNIDSNPEVFRQGKHHSVKRIRFFENKLHKMLEIMETNLESVAGNIDNLFPLEMGSYFPEWMMDCNDVANVTDLTYLTSGWTKAVYKGTYRGSPVALKTVDPEGRDVVTCMEAGRARKACYVRAARKLLKETAILQALAGPHVLKVLGFCFPRDADDTLWVAMVTELGESVDLIKLLQMSWEDRLRVCVEITQIIDFMATTPYGSMSMNDFRRQQFVIVDGTLKLSDVDDAGFDEPVCRTDADCAAVYSRVNITHRYQCIRNRCVGYNAVRNIVNAGRHFVTFLLPNGAPSRLQPMIDKVVDGYNDISMTSRQLVRALNSITKLYQSGWYLNRTNQGDSVTRYKKLESADLPGLYDYRCRFSPTGTGCTISVYDGREAEDICDMDPSCRSFVMSSTHTWAGRTLVHLKNGVDSPSHSPDTTLYIRPG